MSLKTDAYYRNIAEEALAVAGIAEPPISVDAVAAVAGVSVRLVGLPTFFSGAMFVQDGSPVAVLNSKLDELARRRCLAHLLGHELVSRYDPSEAYPRDGDPDHHEAKVVAGELLLPSRMLTEQAAKWFNDYRYLGRIFSVPETEVLEKMRALRLLKARGFAWE